jgi:hypothetical protein
MGFGVDAPLYSAHERLLKEAGTPLPRAVFVFCVPQLGEDQQSAPDDASDDGRYHGLGCSQWMISQPW